MDRQQMKTVKKIRHHHFVSGFSVPIGQPGIRLASIAQRVGLDLDNREEDGLGRAVGTFVELPSGRIVLLRELEYAVTVLGASGPTIDADPTDVVTVGIEALLEDVAASLALARDAIVCGAGVEGERNAAACSASGSLHRDTTNSRSTPAA